MERIWTLPDSIGVPLRTSVVGAAAAFLGRGLILEPGCGAGWPGRLLVRAAEGMRIVGTDISAEQVELARAAAAREDLEGSCEYRVADMAALQLEQFDGAFIHAALHHLADDEVVVLLDKLASAPAGFRVAFYEPVFVEPLPIPKPIARALCRGVSLLRTLAAPRGEFDPALASELDSLALESSRRGWFLSPKETPFELEELTRLLAARFDVELSKPVHFDAIEAGQRLSLMRDGDRRDRLAPRLLRRALVLDALLLKTRAYRLCADRYAFWLFGCVVGE